ncbi:MAG: hypothetical protein Tsb002_12650 [Wenzhouxiangellaceae bacterium]
MPTTRLSWLILSLLFVQPALATWSIVAFDSDTQEVALGSATCLSSSDVPGIDLVSEIPAVAVGLGGGAAQSLLDASGQRRSIINDGVRNGLSATQIRDQLITLTNTDLHQHGIAGAGDTAISHTGVNNFRHASGTEGQAGSLNYAIQGNVLAGPEVVQMSEQALLNTAGDLPARLMAAMEAARDFGGDGRCSCPGGPQADSCGSPPASFDKSAHVGFMLLSRFGDNDDPTCNGGGCARGDYFLLLNVADQPASAPDPVDQLRNQFDDFQQALENRPDAIRSIIDFTSNSNGSLLTLTLFDWRGVALAAPVNNVSVTHAADSGMQSVIGPVIDNGHGSYQTQLLHDGFGADDDRLLVTIDDSVRPVVIPPNRATLTFPTLFADSFEG